MPTKLTVSVDKDVIEDAKHYAKLHRTSISQMIEKYLAVLVKEEKREFDGLGPLTRQLMNERPLVINRSTKELLRDARAEKYA